MLFENWASNSSVRLWLDPNGTDVRYAMLCYILWMGGWVTNNFQRKHNNLILLIHI